MRMMMAQEGQDKLYKDLVVSSFKVLQNMPNQGIALRKVSIIPFFYHELSNGVNPNRNF